jgi:hypothetical protein
MINMAQATLAPFKVQLTDFDIYKKLVVHFFLSTLNFVLFLIACYLQVLYRYTRCFYSIEFSCNVVIHIATCYQKTSTCSN